MKSQNNRAALLVILYLQHQILPTSTKNLSSSSFNDNQAIIFPDNEQYSHLFHSSNTDKVNRHNTPVVSLNSTKYVPDNTTMLIDSDYDEVSLIIFSDLV